MCLRIVAATARPRSAGAGTLRLRRSGKIILATALTLRGGTFARNRATAAVAAAALVPPTRAPSARRRQTSRVSLGPAVSSLRPTPPSLSNLAIRDRSAVDRRRLFGSTGAASSSTASTPPPPPSPPTPRPLREIMREASDVGSELDDERPDEETFHRYCTLACELLEMEELETSERMLRRAIGVFPFHPALNERLAHVLRLTGRNEEAAERMRATIRDLQSNTGNVATDEADDLAAQMYLDLGVLLEDMRPLPGSGPDWDLLTGSGEALRINLDWDPTGEEYDDLTVEDCYRRAVRLDGDSGDAHKRLADCLAVLGEGSPHKRQEATEEFVQASSLLPEDVCCATHKCYQEQVEGFRTGIKAVPLPPAVSNEKTTLDDLSFENIDGGSTAEVAAAFEKHGVVVLPRFLTDNQIKKMNAAVEDVLA